MAATNIKVQVVCPGPVKSNSAANAFTEEKGKAFKDTDHFTDPVKRMPTERCAKVMAVGMAHEMNEIWISTQPALSFLYMSQYMPTIFDWYSNARFLQRTKSLYMKS